MTTESGVRAQQLLSAPRGRALCELLGRSDVVDHDPWSALVDVVSTANYWQAPKRRPWDEVPEPTAQAVATHLVQRPDLAWWWTGPDLLDQWSLVWLDATTRSRRPSRPSHGTSENLTRWRRATVDLEAGPRDPVDETTSGTWWSTPPRDCAVRTSRRAGPAPSVAAVLVEDEQGWVDVQATRRAVDPDARVLTINGPSDWTDLVMRHPLDVTRSRRADWTRLAGREASWVIPDWSALSQDLDGVHLSVGGYLSTAGLPLTLGTSGMTVLAGWDPDETIWLSDRVEDDGTHQTFRRDPDEPLTWFSQ